VDPLPILKLKLPPLSLPPVLIEKSSDKIYPSSKSIFKPFFSLEEFL
jgi:hypothetical protein